MESEYLEVHPEAVSGAGRRTAMTASDWAGWAGRSEGLLRTTAGSARQAKVAAAFETYLSRWNPRLKGLSQRTEQLGGNAVAASYTVSNADTEADALLRTQTDRQQGQASQLTRPINGPF